MRLSSKSDTYMNIEERIEDCRVCGLIGWELVAYAQGVVMRQMAYSYDNPLAPFRSTRYNSS